MLSNLPRVTSKVREGTFAATVARLRDEIQRELRENGTYTIREDQQEFTITVPSAAQPRGPRE